MSQVDEVRNALKDGKLVIGWKNVEAALKGKGLKKVLLSRTVQKRVKDDVLAYSKISEFAFEDFSGDAYELGVLCKKPFAVSVLGIKE